MIQRCTNPKNRQWPDYAGRGITVCERWKKFSQFYEDVGPRPSSQHSLDRINNDGNYEPSNCRWGTDEQQATNKRNNRHIVFNGRTMTLSQWAKELGIHTTGLRMRLKKWTIERALTTPRSQKHIHHFSGCEGHAEETSS